MNFLFVYVISADICGEADGGGLARHRREFKIHRKSTAQTISDDNLQRIHLDRVNRTLVVMEVHCHVSRKRNAFFVSTSSQFAANPGFVRSFPPSAP